MRTTLLFNKDELQRAYIDLKTIDSVANYFKVSKSTIRKNFKKFGITFALNKLKLDDEFFSIDTKDSFYIAGFIAADGCISGREISIRLSSNDKSHLLDINKILKSERTVRDYTNEYSGVSVLRLRSQQMINDLKKFNIVPCKSLIYSFPEYVKTHPLRSHFMRGYFDGDGSFYVQKQHNTKICMSIRGTEKFLTTYRDILEQECNFKVRNYKIPISGGCHQLAYGGNKNIIKIANFLYNDASLFLNRKKDIMLKAYDLLGVK